MGGWNQGKGCRSLEHYVVVDVCILHCGKEVDSCCCFYMARRRNISDLTIHSPMLEMSADTLPVFSCLNWAQESIEWRMNS